MINTYQNTIKRCFIVFITCSLSLTKSLIPSTSYHTPPSTHLSNQITSQITKHSTSRTTRLHMSSSSSSSSSRNNNNNNNNSLRDEIMSRNGDYFKLNRFTGKVEFGSTADLVTTLNGGDKSTINKWLSDERRVALSIWDDKRLDDLGGSIYRLKLMTLQFVTIRLSPQVDVRMTTSTLAESDDDDDDGDDDVIFRLESVSFDPKVEVFPGIGLSPKDLGIQIDVFGELKASDDGAGVTGRIGFTTSGNLAPPLRLAPDVVMENASALINKQIRDFAIASFQRGTRNEFRKFQLAEQERRQ